MTEVVDAELKLESVLRLLVRSEHHAGVVDEDVDAREPCADLYSRRTHACQAVQLQLDCLDRGGSRLGGDGFSRGSKTLRVSAGEHSRGADRRQPLRSHQTQPAGGAGDHADLPCQINAGKYLINGACHANPSSVAGSYRSVTTCDPSVPIEPS